MRPVVVVRVGTGTSAAVPLDLNISPFNVGIGVLVSGTATYSIQHTFDDPGSASPTWFNHVSLNGLTANADGNYAFPVRAVRVNVTAGAGTVTTTFIQAGMPGK